MAVGVGYLTLLPAQELKTWLDEAANASRFLTTSGGNRVYGLWIDVGMGYRLDATTGVPVGNESQTIYMVADGQHVNGECCFE